LPNACPTRPSASDDVGRCDPCVLHRGPARRSTFSSARLIVKSSAHRVDQPCVQTCDPPRRRRARARVATVAPEGPLRASCCPEVFVRQSSSVTQTVSLLLHVTQTVSLRFRSSTVVSREDRKLTVCVTVKNAALPDCATDNNLIAWNGGILTE